MPPPTTIDLSKIKSLSWAVTTSYNASSIITYNVSSQILTHLQIIN